MSGKALVFAHKAQDMTAYTQLLPCHIIIAETVPGLRDASSDALAAHGSSIKSCSRDFSTLVCCIKGRTLCR